MSKAAGKKGGAAGGKGKKKADDLDDLFAEMQLENKTNATSKTNGQGGNSATASGSTSSETKDPTGCTPYKPIVIDESKRVEIRGLGKRPADLKPLETKSGQKQSNPPRIPVAEFYPTGKFPEGQILPHNLDSNSYRITSAEKRAMELLHEDLYNEVREAAEVHKQTRQALQEYLQPGISLMEIAHRIESSTYALVKKDGTKRGWAFPTGLSLNHIAAHFSPNANDTTVLGIDDVLKVDFGVHINGRIMDCAFTVHFNPEYDELVNAVKEATDAGIKAAGVDMRLGDIGGIIQEVIESHECTIKGKTYKVQPIRNLNGHNIEPYRIHGGKSVPMVNNHDQTKMEEGEFYAIETFASTGRGYVTEDLECSHYMKMWDVNKPIIRSDRAKALLNTITTNFNTLCFARRWLDGIGETSYALPLKQLCDSGIVSPYPPLVDIKGSYTAQFEHTFLLRPTCKEVLTRSWDY